MRRGLVAWRRSNGYQPLINRQDNKCQQYCDEKATFHRYLNFGSRPEGRHYGFAPWYGIQSGSAKRMAAHHAFQADPSALACAVGQDGFRGVLRAGREISARTGQEWSNDQLIAAHHCKCEVLHGGQTSDPFTAFQVAEESHGTRLRSFARGQWSFRGAE